MFASYSGAVDRTAVMPHGPSVSRESAAAAKLTANCAFDHLVARRIYNHHRDAKRRPYAPDLGAKGHRDFRVVPRTHSFAATNTILFDHLVGAGEQRRRKFEAQRFSSSEVDDEVEPCRLLDRKVSRLSTFKNAVYEIGRSSIQSENVSPVSYEPACLTVFLGPYRWQFIFECKCGDSPEVRGKLSILCNDDGVDGTAGHGLKRAVKLAGDLYPCKSE